MCGIFGYIGKTNSISTLINGLKRLEYRGYDSSGIAYTKNKKIQIKKAIGKIQELEKTLTLEEKSFIGIGHTRWATHGKVTLNNCHPHKNGNIVIVHNGILENYQELKKELLNNGYTFQGDTDSEVACAYINFLYKKNKNQDLIKILNYCVSIFKGSYAIVGMIQELDKQLFIMKKDSPLIIGIGNNEIYIASDPFACQDKTNSFIFLEDKEFGIISQDNINIYKEGKKKEIIPTTINKSFSNNDKQGFSHYMLKEIHEQIPLLQNWNNYKLEKLEELPNLEIYDNIQIVACGTAYHASLIGKYLLEQYGTKEIKVFIASEYRYQKLFISKKTLVIFVSQSGETADTIACLKRVKELNCSTLGIVNVENSSIARDVDQVIYTEAGTEIAVASTKAYLSQIYLFSLLALKIGITNQKLNFQKVKNAYKELPHLISKILNYNYEKIVEKIWNQTNIFYLGRNIDYITMMEGALKLKEISYIHTESFPAGELKHGTISLIEEHTPVLAMLTQEELATKTLSNVIEVSSRGATVLLLIKENLLPKLHLEEYSKIISIPTSIELLQPLLNIIPLQMIAYTIAKKRKVDIDKPRNLAKSVTVE